MMDGLLFEWYMLVCLTARSTYEYARLGQGLVFALDGGNEARYVRHQGHGLGIQPLYLPLLARDSMPGLGPS